MDLIESMKSIHFQMSQCGLNCQLGHTCFHWIMTDSIETSKEFSHMYKESNNSTSVVDLGGGHRCKTLDEVSKFPKFWE